MSPEFASLVGVAIGSILTGGLTIWNSLLTVRAERKQQRAKEALEGLLSVHDALTEMSALYGKFTTQALTSFTSRELKPLESIQTSQSFSRLSYHLGLYAPDMLPEFEKIRDSSKAFMDNWTEGVLAVARGQQKPDIVLSIGGKMWDQAKAIADFQAKLSSHAHEKYFKE